MNKKQARFKVSRWIMLSLAVLSNAFIVAYSCINNTISNQWNRAFTNIFTSFINAFTHKEIVTVPLKDIDAKLSDEDGYKYNYLPGYKVEEIPLGSAKQIECTFDPIDATDKSISYVASPSDMVTLNQSGSTLSVVGMKAGECVITAKSNDGGFESKVNVKVVETVAPEFFEISLDKTDIAIGTTQTINFDIDGGVLTHDELINFRYYDTRKLHYSSSNESVARVDKYGVIYPIAIGSSKITVSNNSGVTKSIDVTVSDGTTPSLYSDLAISGSDTCYANDMILDQSSKKYHYQLTPKDGSKELNPEDFIWESSNELLVKVDKHGVMRGFRKSSNDDESAIITAKSKLTGQEAVFNVLVKNQLPTKMDFYLDIGEKGYWNPKDYTLTVGDNIVVKLSYNPSTANKKVNIENTDPSVISITNEGDYFVMHVLKEGTCIITITSIVNPELTASTTYTVVQSGAISTDDISDVGHYIRKSLGHAAVFMVAQIFTFLTFFMFFYERKWYVYASMSLGEGLFISGLSELIQYFVPTRSGAFLDVLIDFAGVVVGAALIMLGIFIVKKIKEKKANKKQETTSQE